MLKRISSHAILFFIICIVALSQVFVDKSFIPYSLSEILKPSFWQRVSATVAENDQLFEGCFQEIPDSVVDSVIGITTSGVMIEAQQKSQSSWDIVAKYPDDTQQILVEDIIYANPQKSLSLSRSLGVIDDLVLYPACTRSCMLYAYSLSTGETAEMTVVTTGSDTHDDSFSDLEIIFYDEESHHLVYQSREQQKAFVAEYSPAEVESGHVRPYLWHDISLRTNENTTQEIIGVQKDLLDQLHLIVLVTDMESTQERVVLYNLSTPALKLVHVPEGMRVDSTWQVHAPDNACVPIAADDGAVSFLSFE